MAMEYDNDGGAAFWYIISVSPRTGMFYFDLLRTRPRGLEIVHSQVLSRGEVYQFAAHIKPLPDYQLRTPTPEEISKYRARTT